VEAAFYQFAKYSFIFLLTRGASNSSDVIVGNAIKAKAKSMMATREHGRKGKEKDHHHQQIMSIAGKELLKRIQSNIKALSVQFPKFHRYRLPG